MAQNIDNLNAEISTLDADEQQEENEVASLKTKVAQLESALATAQASGNDAAIQAATDKLHAVNMRLSALLSADASASVTSIPAPSPNTNPVATLDNTTSAATLQVNIPPKTE